MIMEIIAEIGQNHNGDMAPARRLIAEAKAAGATVAKFQVYDARGLFSREGYEWLDYDCKTEVTATTSRRVDDRSHEFDSLRLAFLRQRAARCIGGSTDQTIGTSLRRPTFGGAASP
jgi:hypothetical protein